MERFEAVAAVEHIAKEHILTEQELLSTFRGSFDQSREELPATHTLNYSELTSYVGALIVTGGIAVLIGGMWDSLSDITRVIATLGIGMVFYVLGMLLFKDPKNRVIATALSIVAAVVLPAGLLVVMQIAGYAESGFLYFLIPSALSAAIYLASWRSVNQTLFLFFGIIYTTIFYQSLTSWIISMFYLGVTEKYALYAPLAAGVAYLSLARYFRDKKDVAVTGFLYTFGTLAILTTCLIMPSLSIQYFWELAYPFILAGFMYLGVKWNVRSILVLSLIFTAIYLIDITAAHFAGTIGWPLSLVFVGIIMIWIGSFGGRLYKKMK